MRESFYTTYQQDRWLDSNTGPYRATTDNLEMLIRKDLLGKVKPIFEGFDDPANLANAVYFPPTGYLHVSTKPGRQGDTNGSPLFEEKGSLYEGFPAADNGIRLLGLALQNKADDVVKYLVEQGARIPHVSPDFPKTALQSQGPAEHWVKDPAFEYEAHGARFSNIGKDRGHKSGPADVAYEYKRALEKYLKDNEGHVDYANRAALITKLGVDPMELEKGVVHPTIAKVLADKDVTIVKIFTEEEVAAMQRQRSA